HDVLSLDAHPGTDYPDREECAQRQETLRRPARPPPPLLIGETWMPAIAGTVRDVLDPASREVSLRSPTPTRQTLSPGPAAFDDGAWRGLTGAQRARILWRIADPDRGARR